MVKAGDHVRVLGNTKDTCWEFGYVEDVVAEDALINFGSRSDVDVNMCRWKNKGELEVII